MSEETKMQRRRGEIEEGVAMAVIHLRPELIGTVKFEKLIAEIMHDDSYNFAMHSEEWGSGE